ncbi:MAG TPA: phosphate ABC transporter substrate-binding protein PstS [Acetobacteraceae bacterium]
MRRRLLVLATIGLGVLLAPSARAQQQITGAGSTFVYPVLSKWAATYAKLKGVQVNYQSIGSGGGIAQIKAGTVDFGASDAPLSSAALKEAGLAQFPVIVGGIVPVVNLAGVKAGDIKLTGAVLADIYLGKIKKWNDPRIAKLNPGVKLPDANIYVVHRSDGSGTTYNFVDFLSKVSPDWKQKIGVGTSVAWPTGVGGKGNEGVAAYVQRIKGAIGYVEYAYVVQNKMTYALIENAVGDYPAPSVAAFQAAAASADWKSAEDFDLVMTNAPGKDAYPIAASTFVLMRVQPKNAAAAKAALDFFAWSLAHGQALAESLDYVPLPPALVSQIEGYVGANIHG